MWDLGPSPVPSPRTTFTAALQQTQLCPPKNNVQHLLNISTFSCLIKGENLLQRGRGDNPRLFFFFKQLSTGCSTRARLVPWHHSSAPCPKSPELAAGAGCWSCHVGLAPPHPLQRAQAVVTQQAAARRRGAVLLPTAGSAETMTEHRPPGC